MRVLQLPTRDIRIKDPAHPVEKKPDQFLGANHMVLDICLDAAKMPHRLEGRGPKE